MTTKKNIHALILTGFLLLALVAIASAIPQGAAMSVDDPHAASAERIVVSVETFATAADGETESSGFSTMQLTRGESAAAYIACGFFDRDGGTNSRFAMGGSGSLDPESGPPFSDLPNGNPTTWGIRCTLISWNAGEIKLDVQWERIGQKKPGEAVREVVCRRVITFTEEGRHLLDVIGTADGEPDAAGLVNRTVELEVRVEERPALASRTIQYDLWLVNEAATGERISRPIRLIGRQGERMDFSFETIRWPVPGIELKNGGGIEALMEIKGTVRGRIRPDGSIGISLSSGRRFGLAASGENSPGWCGNGKGRKYFSMMPGETVSTLFPEPVGQSTLFRQAGDLPKVPPQGVTVSDRRIQVQFKPFFEGHSMSLVLCAVSPP